jgi:hypothetical protein
MQLEYNLNEV